MPANLPNELEAIHNGHFDIGENDVNRVVQSQHLERRLS